MNRFDIIGIYVIVIFLVEGLSATFRYRCGSGYKSIEIGISVIAKAVQMYVIAGIIYRLISWWAS